MMMVMMMMMMMMMMMIMMMLMMLMEVVVVVERRGGAQVTGDHSIVLLLPQVLKCFSPTWIIVIFLGQSEAFLAS